MKQERDRLAGVYAKSQDGIQTLKSAAAKAEKEKQLFPKDFDATQAMLKKVEDFNKELKAHVFRTQNHSTYGAAGSMSVRGPSPNENVGRDFVSPS